jgi:preprotein translocase subunit SecA
MACHVVTKLWTQRNRIYKERTRHLYKNEVREVCAFKLKIVFAKEIDHGRNEKQQRDRKIAVCTCNLSGLFFLYSPN